MFTKRLPKELISRTLSYIPGDALLECMKVCKEWYQLGSVHYYKDVHLTNNHLKFLECCLLTRVDGRHNGDFVKSLDFFGKQEELAPTHFGLLISKYHIFECFD